MTELSQLTDLIKTHKEVDATKANSRKENLRNTLNQLQLGEQICHEAIEFCQSIETAAENCRKHKEIPNFLINLSAQFHNLAVLNPSASLAFVPALKEAFFAELERTQNSIKSIKKII